MDAQLLRERFHSFLNDDATYRRFTKSCVDARSRCKRLRYWQETIWQGFVCAFPEYEVLTVQSIIQAFYVCHLHAIPLAPLRIHVPKKLYITTVSSGDENAPYGYRHPFSMPESDETRQLELDVCERCLAVTDSIRHSNPNNVSLIANRRK